MRHAAHANHVADSENEVVNESENLDNFRESSHTRFDFLDRNTLITKLRESRLIEIGLRDKNFLLACTLKRTIERKETFREKIQTLCDKGGYNEIAYNLYRSVKENKTSGREGVLDLLRTVSRNLLKEKTSKGKRYSSCKTTVEFYESLWIMFGPKAVMWVSDNNWGPSIDTVRAWRKQNSISFDFSKPETNIKLVAEIYKKYKEKNGESRAIPFLFEEDETSIEQRPEYDEKTDVFGYCGLKGENHQCQEYYVIKVSLLCIILVCLCLDDPFSSEPVFRVHVVIF